jgi:hypothetical protein
MNLPDRVCQLIDAENEADAKKAEALLATDFVAITRRSGQEDSRKELLARIANPPTLNPFREPSQFQIWESGASAWFEASSRTKDSSTHAVIGEFRNLHVFRKEGDAWMCVDWQVTELPTGEVPRAAADRLAVAKAYEDGKHRRYALL